jgi:arylamine N-acetyltransferase
MSTYTDAQLTRYLSHIGYLREDARQHAAQDPLGCLTALQHHHMARVPFESLSLHYSRHRLLSLDPKDLFSKVVDRGRGGYCMEVNTFFAVVLRSLGFTLYSVGGRVYGPGVGYKGW